MSSITSSLSTDANNIKNTFSSWDSCMAHSYCKWPAIVGIIVGSIILFSVLWCVASCLCCGATLCGSCIQCLTCFHCCGACRGRDGGSRGGGTRHKDDYSQMPPTPYNGYQPPASAMTYQPQFAQFDSATKPVHADSLPAMPTWETARNVRVENHESPTNRFGNDVEMGRLRPTQSRPQPGPRRGYDQVPTGPMSPMAPPSNYGQFDDQPHGYNSDIGAQRLQHQQTGYSDFEPSPLSPAPTYRTVASAQAMGHTDRFARGALSPTPSQYNTQNYTSVARDHAWSPLPSHQHQATEYQSFRRSPSPPPEHQPLTYDHRYEENSSARPPSLLQIGRKPVMGSQREI